MVGILAALVTTREEVRALQTAWILEVLGFQYFQLFVLRVPVELTGFAVLIG